MMFLTLRRGHATIVRPNPFALTRNSHNRPLSVRISVKQANRSACPFWLRKTRTYATTTAPKGRTRSTKTATLKKPASATKAVAKAKETKAEPKPKSKVKAKPKSKPKTKPKKKAVATKRKAKVPLTETQKILKQVSELKKVALLKRPVLLPPNGYLVLSTEQKKGDLGVAASTRSKEISQKYRNMSAAEREHYDNVAHQNRLLNQSTLKDWIERHTPEQIRIANNARKALSRISKLPIPADRKIAFVSHSYSLLQDARQVKRATTPYLQFVKERWASGEFSGMSVVDAGKQMGKEWKSMSKDETQRYHDAFDLENAQYRKQFETTYGKPSTMNVGTSE